MINKLIYKIFLKYDIFYYKLLLSVENLNILDYKFECFFFYMLIKSFVKWV